MPIIPIPIDFPLIKTAPKVAAAPVRAHDWMPLELASQHMSGRRRCVHPARIYTGIDLETEPVIRLCVSGHPIEQYVYVWASFYGTQPVNCSVAFASDLQTVNQTWIQSVESVFKGTMLEVSDIYPKNRGELYHITISPATDFEGTAYIGSWGVISYPLQMIDNTPEPS